MIRFLFYSSSIVLLSLALLAETDDPFGPDDENTRVAEELMWRSLYRMHQAQEKQSQAHEKWQAQETPATGRSDDIEDFRQHAKEGLDLISEVILAEQLSQRDPPKDENQPPLRHKQSLDQNQDQQQGKQQKTSVSRNHSQTSASGRSQTPSENPMGYDPFGGGESQAESTDVVAAGSRFQVSDQPDQELKKGRWGRLQWKEREALLKSATVKSPAQYEDLLNAFYRNFPLSE